MDTSKGGRRRAAQALQRTPLNGLTMEQLVDIVIEAASNPADEARAAASALHVWNRDRFTITDPDCDYLTISEVVLDAAQEYLDEHPPPPPRTPTVLEYPPAAPPPPWASHYAAPAPPPPGGWPFSATATAPWGVDDWVEWDSPGGVQTGVVLEGPKTYTVMSDVIQPVSMFYCRVGVSVDKEILIPAQLLRRCTAIGAAEAAYEESSPTTNVAALNAFTMLFETLRGSREAFYRLTEHTDRQLAERQARVCNIAINTLVELSGIAHVRGRNVHESAHESVQETAAISLSGRFRPPTCLHPGCTKPTTDDGPICDQHPAE